MPAKRPLSLRLWQWKNRMERKIYHFTHGIKSSPMSMDHMRECRHCREGFEKWRRENP